MVLPTQAFTTNLRTLTAFTEAAPRWPMALSASSSLTIESLIRNPAVPTLRAIGISWKHEDFDTMESLHMGIQRPNSSPVTGMTTIVNPKNK